MYERFKKGELYVSFTSKANYDDFIKFCENKNLRWNAGERPAEFNPRIDTEDLILCHGFNQDSDSEVALFGQKGGLSCHPLFIQKLVGDTTEIVDSVKFLKEVAI